MKCQTRRLTSWKTVDINTNNLTYSDDTILMAKTKGELKSLLRVKEESEKDGLKLNIQKTNIPASSLITSTDGKKIGSTAIFYFLGLQNQCEL